MEYRTCKKCKEVKPLTPEFWNKTGRQRDRLRIVCKECAKKQKRDYYYGITAEATESKKIQFIMETQKAKFSFTRRASMTKNKIYEFIREVDSCYILKDDTGKIVELHKTRFKKIDRT